MRYNPSINRLRGIAVFLTIFDHLGIFRFLKTSSVAPYIKGDGGVILFFAISGFVISATLSADMERRVSVFKVFWLKRMTRIWPQSLLWITLNVLLWLGLYRLGTLPFLDVNLEGALAALANAYNFFAVLSPRHSDMGEYWSLSLEEQFYLIFPFILYFIRKPVLRGCLLMCIYLALNVIPPELKPGFRAEAIILGVIWFDIWKYWKPQKSYLPAFCVALLLGLQSFLPWLSSFTFSPETVAENAMAVVSLLILIPISISPDLLPSFGVLDYLGERSYALYLAHVPTFILVQHLATRFLTYPSGEHGIYAAVIATTGLVLAFVLSEFTFRVVEEPVRKWGKARSLLYG